MRTSGPTLVVLGGALWVAAPGCESNYPEGSSPTARDLLVEPLRLDVDPAESQVRLVARIHDGDVDDEAKVVVAIERGWLDVAARGDQLALDRLELGFAPIDLPSELLPAGVRLVDVRVHLSRPALSEDAVWRSDDGAAGATVDASLELDWSLEVAGRAYQLAPQQLTELPLTLSVSGGGEALGATLLASAPGVIWRWDGAVFLGDLDVAVCATW